jgi:hypothetical protein
MCRPDAYPESIHRCIPYHLLTPLLNSCHLELLSFRTSDHGFGGQLGNNEVRRSHRSFRIISTESIRRVKSARYPPIDILYAKPANALLPLSSLLWPISQEGLLKS